MGFEPMTPALRERCSGQLSYVGVGGECSRGPAFGRYGFAATDARRAAVRRAVAGTGLDALAARHRDAVSALPVCPHVRNALPAGPLLARGRRRHRARGPRRAALART